MKYIFRIIFTLLIAGLVFADTTLNDFQNDLSALRRKVIPMCVQLQNGNQNGSTANLLTEIDVIISDWDKLTLKYKDNPPAEYSKNKTWPGYFGEVKDNFLIMRNKAELGSYSRAVKFCGMNCGVFVNINQVSGVVKLSDRMFMLRKNVKTMMAMSKGGNKKGAEHLAKHNVEIVNAMLAVAEKLDTDKKAASAVKDMQSIKQAYERFVKTITDKDAVPVEEFQVFMKTFSNSYIKYI